MAITYKTVFNITKPRHLQPRDVELGDIVNVLRKIDDNEFVIHLNSEVVKWTTAAIRFSIPPPYSEKRVLRTNVYKGTWVMFK